MNLISLYKARIPIRDIEKRIEGSLDSISVNKLRGYCSIVIKMNRTEDSMYVEDFMNNKFNEIFESKVVNRLRINTGTRYSIPGQNTFTMISPFVSKSREREKDTYEFYEPDECTINIKLIAKEVQRETIKPRRRSDELG